VVSIGELTAGTRFGAAVPFEPESSTASGEDLINQIYAQTKAAASGENLPIAGKGLMHVDFSEESEETIDELSKIPAYQRRNMKISKGKMGGGREMSRYTLSHNPDEGPKLRRNNSFLHDKAD
jgi:hypothetical protein